MRAPAFTRADVQRLAVYYFEITTSIPRRAAFWDSIAGMRDSVALDLLDLAEATNTVAQADGACFGDTHDFYLYTEALADLYVTRSTDGEHGVLRDEAEADALVRAALSAPGVKYGGA